MQTLGNVALCVAGFQYIKKNTFIFGKEKELFATRNPELSH